MGDSGGSVVSVDVERISFGGKVRQAGRPPCFLAVPCALWGSFGCCCSGWVGEVGGNDASFGVRLWGWFGVVVKELNFFFSVAGFCWLHCLTVCVSVAAFRQFSC
jgi:hypothetical protein